jgi:hypothetical protein
VRARRAVARKKRHSGRQRKAKLRVARLHARVAAQRRDFSHKLSRSLVDRFTHLAFENLNISALARGMLAQSVHDAARNQIVQHVQLQGSMGRWRRRAARPARNLPDLPRVRHGRAQDARPQGAPLRMRLRPRPQRGGRAGRAAPGGLRAGNRPSGAKRAGCRLARPRSRLLWLAECSRRSARSRRPVGWARLQFVGRNGPVRAAGHPEGGVAAEASAAEPVHQCSSRDE